MHQHARMNRHGLLPRVPAFGGDDRFAEPSLAASLSRRSVPGTRRSSPARPISPKATMRCGTGLLQAAEAMASAAARSAAGSLTLAPPTVET